VCEIDERHERGVGSDVPSTGGGGDDGDGKLKRNGYMRCRGDILGTSECIGANGAGYAELQLRVVLSTIIVAPKFGIAEVRKSRGWSLGPAPTRWSTIRGRFEMTQIEDRAAVG
jgi:hypothetical protein